MPYEKRRRPHNNSLQVAQEIRGDEHMGMTAEDFELKLVRPGINRSLLDINESRSDV